MYIEDFPKGFLDYMPKLDQNYADIVASSESVEVDTLTKEYKATHTFVTSLAGTIRASSPLGPSTETFNSTVNRIQAHDTYPGVADTPLPGVDQRYIQLGKLHGNVVLNLSMKRAQRLRGVVDNYPATVIRQFSKLLAHTLAMTWYMDPNATVAEIDADHTNVTASRTGNIVTVTQEHASDPLLNRAKGTHRRLLPAMQFDLWNATEATCFTTRSWAMLVSHMNMYGTTGASSEVMQLYFNNTQDAIEFTTEVGTTKASNIRMVPYSAFASRASDQTGLSRFPCGYLSWMLDSGTIFGDYFGDSSISATSHGSLFKSLVKTSTGSLTEATVNEYISSFESANGILLDTVVTTPGVSLNLLATYGLDAGSTIVRIPREGNQAQRLELGTDDIFGYRWNGHVFQVLTSNYMAGGEFIVLKRSEGNLVRYEPPGIDDAHGAVSSEGGPSFDPKIEWLGLNFGDTIWMPSTATGGGKTDGIEAPYDLIVQHAAKEVRGIRLAGCTETVLGD
jgi:hypothetical protein